MTAYDWEDVGAHAIPVDTEDDVAAFWQLVDGGDGGSPLLTGGHNGQAGRHGSVAAHDDDAHVGGTAIEVNHPSFAQGNHAALFISAISKQAARDAIEAQGVLDQEGTSFQVNCERVLQVPVQCHDCMQCPIQNNADIGYGTQCQ
jgi:hypothetical protein